MAASPNRPIASTMKRSILKFIENLVPTSISRAIEVILSPCCKITATATAVCGIKAGTYNVTVTLSEGVNLAGKGIAFFANRGGFTPYIDGSTTFTITNVPNSPTLGSTLALQIGLPTQMDAVNGQTNMSYTVVGYVFPQIPVIFPTC